MADGRTQHQAHWGSETAPSGPRALVENATTSTGPETSSVASPVAGHPHNDIQKGASAVNAILEQRDSTTSAQRPNPRPFLGPREFSNDLVDEIRKVIRQEFLGACNPKDQSRRASIEDGGAGRISTSEYNSAQEKRLSQTSMSAQLTRDESNVGSRSPTSVPSSDSDHAAMHTPTPTPSPPANISAAFFQPTFPATMKLDLSKPAVRFSEDVTVVRSPLSGPALPPAKKAPRPMYRRISSSGGDLPPEWGVLFDGNGFPTVRCEQVLGSLAKCLAEEFPPRDGVVITPEKLGLFYSRFRIEGEIYPFEGIFHLFPREENGAGAMTGSTDRLAVYHDRVSDFFTDLDCEYYLVPPPPAETTAPLTISPTAISAATSPSSPVFPRPDSYSSFLLPASKSAPASTAATTTATSPYQPVRPRRRSARPCVPALTLAGFAQFITVCMLAHPDEEARRLDSIASELALVVVDAGLSNPPAVLGSGAPDAQFGPIPALPYPPPSSPSTAGRAERLPRQFVRSLLPVKPDENSRKILAAAVDDLLCDLDLDLNLGLGLSLPSSPSAPTASPAGPRRPSAPTPTATALAFRAAEQNRRWSFASIPTTSTLSLSPGWPAGVTPRLPPPPVPLPRDGSGSPSSAQKALPFSSSAVSLTKFHSVSPSFTPTVSRSDGGGGGGEGSTRSDSPSSYRQHHPRYSYHELRRYEPAEAAIPPHRPQGQLQLQGPPPPPPSSSLSSSAMVVAPRSGNRTTRFELGGEGGEDSATSSDAASTVATVTARPTRADRRSSYHGYEHEREREREWAREMEREREREMKRAREKERERERRPGAHRDRDRDRNRDRDHDRDRDRDRDRGKDRDRDCDRDRRPAPATRPPGDRRWGSALAIPGTARSGPAMARTMSSGDTAGDRNNAAAQQQQQQQQPQQQPRAKGVSFYDERDRG
ncbi:putative hydroxyproline-rich glycoprotein dz-hrgp protein [Rosellinia necatrix]|uniref:Putative hydroxyproline-rich glycoprotein dz-hrgp protein n=1 Tax=Rosellinia necatrix TaxID=77044 RepID=A0A1S7UKM0_ROSNE|nr:putative hydroxyproline-rich glycoprotein dz-hrgp protein [Rosellinia necatrix]